MSGTNRSSTVRVLKRIQEDVTCPVCLDKFKDPKVLHCHHEFCKNCLIHIAEKNKEALTITCPKCRLDTTLPDGGVEGLQSAMSAQKFLDLEDSLQRSVEKMVTCELHDNQKIMMFCDPCNTLICSQCITKEHSGHPCKDVSEVSQQCRERLSTGLDAATKVLKKMEALTNKFEQREEEMLIQQDKLEDQINSMINQLQQALEAKRSSLIEDMHNLFSTKLKSLNRRKNEVKNWHARLENGVREGHGLLKDDREEMIISGMEKRLSSVDKTCSDFRQASIDVTEEANVGISSNINSTLESLETFATITTCSGCPQKCYARGNALSSACVGETESVMVYVMNNKTQPCMEGSLNDINFEVVSDINGKIVNGVAKRVKENQYELSYTPKFKGFHELSITIRDQHIYGSPFRVAVKSSITSLGIPYKTITTIPSPCAVAINHSGNMFILSETDQSIFVVKQNGKMIRQIEVSAIFAGIAVGDDDSIYTVNAIENQVVKFSPDGAPVSATVKGIGSTSPRPLNFNSPKGIAYNSSNKKIYVSNTNSHEIKVLNEDLSFHKTIGKEGAGKMQFKSPRGICCDSAGRVIVADSNNDRIQVFSAEGKFVRMFGQPGDQPGSLKWPLGVATDAAKQIYVSEGMNDRISIFGANGSFLKCFSVGGNRGIAVDSNCGTVLVCSDGYNIIRVY